MENVKKLYLTDIGNVCFIKNPRAKRLSIRLKEFNMIRVTVPARMSIKEATSYVYLKKDWITKHMEKIRSNENQYTIFTPQSTFTTKYHRIEISTQHVNTTKTSINNGLINIQIPESVSYDNEQIQIAIRKTIEDVLRLEAKYHLPEWLEEIAQKHRFTYNHIYIKNLKSRWGSCSCQNNINLNLHLMRLPHDLIQYVLCHELVHTIHKNHGNDFWSCLLSIEPDAKGKQKKIREYNPSIY